MTVVQLGDMILGVVASGSYVILVDDIVGERRAQLYVRKRINGKVVAVHPDTGEIFAQGEDIECIVVTVPPQKYHK